MSAILGQSKMIEKLFWGWLWFAFQNCFHYVFIIPVLNCWLSKFKLIFPKQYFLTMIWICLKLIFMLDPLSIGGTIWLQSCKWILAVQLKAINSSETQGPHLSDHGQTCHWIHRPLVETFGCISCNWILTVQLKAINFSETQGPHLLDHGQLKSNYMTWRESVLNIIWFGMYERIFNAAPFVILSLYNIAQLKIFVLLWI